MKTKKCSSAAKRTGRPGTRHHGAARKIHQRAQEQTHHLRASFRPNQAAARQKPRRANDLNAATADLTGKRQAIVAQLDPELVRTYDVLRKSKKGRAVAPIKGTSCSLCGHEIPIGLLPRQAGNEVMFCSNCERILLP